MPGSPSRRPWGLTADTPQPRAPCDLLPASSRAPALCLVGVWGVHGGAPCWPVPPAPQASWTALRSAGAAARASPHILMLTGLRQCPGHLRITCQHSASCWGDAGSRLPSACGCSRGHALTPWGPPCHWALRGTRAHSTASSRSAGPRGVIGHTLTPWRPPGPWALEWPRGSARSQPWPFPRALWGHYPEASFLTRLALLDRSPCLIRRMGSVCV